MPHVGMLFEKSVEKPHVIEKIEGRHRAVGERAAGVVIVQVGQESPVAVERRIVGRGLSAVDIETHDLSHAGSFPTSRSAAR